MNPVPEEFLRLGSMSYTGTFNGFLDDFKAKGKALTAIGNLDADIAFSQKDKKFPVYSGTLQSDNIDLQTLLNDKNLGSTSFNLTVDGKGITASTLAASLSGTINHFGYGDYDIKTSA